MEKDVQQRMGTTIDLGAFLIESNMIEGIVGVNAAELLAADTFLRQATLSIADVEQFVSATQPGAELRRRENMNVRIGNYYPPRGGTEIVIKLENILHGVNTGVYGPLLAYQKYEHLHPFMDGNGRSGRMIWLWRLLHDGKRPVDNSFLQTFHYQVLQAFDGKP